MKNLILFDDPDQVLHLRPFTYTRPIGEIRIGINTLREKWERALGQRVNCFSSFHLADKYPCPIAAVNTLVNSSYFPTKELCERILHLPLHHALISCEGGVLALRLDELSTRQFMSEQEIEQLEVIEYDAVLQQLNRIWNIFQFNGKELENDFNAICAGRNSAPLSSDNTLIGPPELLFIEEGATVQGAILNTQKGPIYIGKGAEVMEGCLLRGPIALGEEAGLKMGAKIYGPTTIGPYCKVGGEVNNSVLFGYSNKGHDGFLGNSVIGEWCNIGADSNNSNLKNNYSEVKVWNYALNDYENTGLQFCGLFMGDHSKCGINTMFNTGTVVGVSANIFGGGFPPKFIPSFAWGGAEGCKTYRLEEAMNTAERVMLRRNIRFDDTDEQLLAAVFNEDADYRLWEQTENNEED